LNQRPPTPKAAGSEEIRLVPGLSVPKDPSEFILEPGETLSQRRLCRLLLLQTRIRVLEIRTPRPKTFGQIREARRSFPGARGGWDRPSSFRGQEHPFGQNRGFHSESKKWVSRGYTINSRCNIRLSELLVDRLFNFVRNSSERKELLVFSWQRFVELNL
jgi:hypothetical protein